MKRYGSNANALQTECDSNASKGKERKVKENKLKESKIQYAEFVKMTNAEYEKLVSTHSKEFVNNCIKILDNYKGANNKVYKNDYRAILSWVVEKVEKENSLKRNYKRG